MFWHRYLLDIIADNGIPEVMKRDASALRARIRQTEQHRADHVEQVLHEPGPLIRGTLGERARVCGHPGCRCTRGELHVSKMLSVGVAGRLRQVHIPASDEVAVAEKTQRYRRLRQARTDLVALGGETLRLVDQLRDALLEAYPRGAPIPPPGRRGRPRKEMRRGRR